MDTPSEPLQLSAMVPAGRFHSREEADALASVALEAGIVAPVMNATRATAEFDMSMGAVGAVAGFTVFVNPADVERLASELEKGLEIDAHDPLRALATGELRRLADAPLDANLTEKVIARKLLASRPDSPGEGAKEPPPPPGGPRDPHAGADARLAKWLGGLLIFYAALYLSIFTISFTRQESPGKVRAEEAILRRDSSLRTRRAAPADGFAGGVRIPILGLLPFALCVALVSSRRQLPDGTSRPMFSEPWRKFGWVTLLTALGAFALLVGWVAWPRLVEMYDTMHR